MRESQVTGLVDAVLDEAVRKAAAEPGVRRADFRNDTVTAVNSNGTVSCGAISARRYSRYANPTVGDRIVLMQSGNRNWIALGTLAGQEAGGWTNLTLASGYTNPGHGYTASWLREGKRIYLRGRFGPSSGSVPSDTTLATLPAAIRPASNLHVGFAAQRNQISGGASLTRGEIAPGGILKIYEGGTLPSWIGLDGATWTTD